MKEEDTSLIIKKLDPAKAHGCDKDDQNLWWFINCPFNNNIQAVSKRRWFSRNLEKCMCSCGTQKEIKTFGKIMIH